MAYITVYKDFIFVEDDNSKAKRKSIINADLSGIRAQMKTLNNVKDTLIFLPNHMGEIVF